MSEVGKWESGKLHRLQAANEGFARSKRVLCRLQTERAFA